MMTGIILRNVLDVLLPSVCSIFRSGPSDNLQHCGRKEGGRRKELDSNIADAVVPEVLLLPPRHWVTAVPAAGVAGALCLDQSSVREERSSNIGRNNSRGLAARRKNMDFEGDIGEYGVQLLPPTAVWKSLC